MRFADENGDDDGMENDGQRNGNGGMENEAHNGSDDGGGVAMGNRVEDVHMGFVERQVAFYEALGE